MHKEIGNDTATVHHRQNVSFGFLAFSIWGFFAFTIVTGVFLSVHFVPVFNQAFSSVLKVNEEVPFGWMARRLHAAGGSFLLVFLLIHLVRVFCTGAYKIRPQTAWILEVLLIFSTVWLNFTGTFLPLSQSAFGETSTILSSLSSLLWVGGFMAEFLRGGKELSSVALGRFYSMHIGFSLVIGLFLFFHYRMGKGEKEAEDPILSGPGIVAFVISVSLLFIVISFLPGWFTDALKGPANPTANPENILFPWYLLFLPETLPLFSAAYPFWAFVLLMTMLLCLVLLPLIDRNLETKLRVRPVAVAVVLPLVVAWIYFSLVGSANATYGEKVMVPDRTLTSAEIRGATVFAEKNCAYCHQVAGKGGRRQGPDLTVITRQGRSRDWIQRFVYNARLYRPGTAMPRYEIPLEDLEALSAYLVSIDPRKGNLRSVKRADLLLMSFSVEVGGENR